MKIKLLTFGITTDILGFKTADIDISKLSTVKDLRKHLNTSHPQLIKLSSLAIACNEEYASDDQVLTEGMVIALIPPVSGG